MPQDGRRACRGACDAVEPSPELLALQDPRPDRAEAFSIAEEPFRNWWTALHAEDARDFRELGGDALLARFVFAYQYLTTQGAQSPLTAKTDAWAAAAGLSLHDAALPGQAETAWTHPAVAELLSRFFSRTKREIGARIEMRYAALIENMTFEAAKPDTPIKDQAIVAAEVIKYLKLRSNEDEGQAKRRMKGRTPQGPRNVTHDHDDAAPKPEQLEGYINMLVDKFGSEKLAGMIVDAKQPETP